MPKTKRSKRSSSAKKSMPAKTKKGLDLRQAVYWIVIGTVIAEILSFASVNYLLSDFWSQLDLYVPAVIAALIGGVVAGYVTKDRKIGALYGFGVGVIYSIVNFAQLLYILGSFAMLPPLSLIGYTIVVWIVFGVLGGIIGSFIPKRK